MNSSMTAWQLSPTAPQGLELVSRPRPVAQDGEMIVRLHAASLNYRDLMVRRGHYGERHPIVPLVDGVGEVVELGKGVTEFRVGQRIASSYFPYWIDGEIEPQTFATSHGANTYDGVLADYFVQPAGGAVAVPEHLSSTEAAALSCAGVTAWNALFVSARTQPGDTVLILGTGGVSLFALQFAKLAGARVIITSSDDTKLARARQLGADATINYRTHTDWPQQVLALTQGAGVDLVVDTVAGSGLNDAVASVRPGGTIAVIGVLGGGEAPVSTIEILKKNVRVQGILVGSVAMFRAMNRAIALHQLKPVVDRVFAFNDTRDAYAHLESGRHFGKVVIAR